MINSEKFLIVSDGEIRKEWNIKWNFNAEDEELSSLKAIIFDAFRTLYPAITIEYITTDSEEETTETFLFGNTDEDIDDENKLIDVEYDFAKEIKLELKKYKKIFSGESPYIETKIAKYAYNPEFGDDRICECGHHYYRHFDSYEKMDPVGCKYCECYIFKEKID